MDLSPEALRALMIFCPFAVERQMQMRQSGGRFVHYSGAEAAYHIIRSRKMRLRNASVMNDFSEIEHGLSCLRFAWSGSAGERIRKLLETSFPGLQEEVVNLFNDWLPIFRVDTYIASLSEHDDDEDELGRLSMWRAYGGSSGVAMVLNPGVFLSVSDALAAYTSPVAYLTEEQFAVELNRVADNMESARDFLLEFGREEVRNYLFHAFRSSVLCTKHPGFKEEREWRIIYSPTYEKSKRIEMSVEVVRGVPQIIQSTPLQDVPEEDLVGADPALLLNRLIVGPTEHPGAIRAAMIVLLGEAGVQDAASKVVISSIPLRH